MSLLIKGMEMPKNCRYCAIKELHNDDGQESVCQLICGKSVEEYIYCVDKRHPDCPLVEIPTPHERLISSKNALDAVLQSVPRDEYFDQKIYEAIRDVPTIIETEE